MKQVNYQGALQKPVGSGFNASSTTKDVINGIDLTGKVAIVTGGYAGIGLETTRTLAEAGARVWVPARSLEKAKQNLVGVDNVIIVPMDLMDADSITSFAETFLEKEDALHILINNAGIMWVPLRRDKRGYESQLATNHLGHFQLTALLWPALKSANGARVVNLSSFGHQMASFNFDDPNFNEGNYESLQGYGRSKTANILFSVELDYKCSEYGVRAYSVAPGSVNHTDLGREAPMELFQQMGTHDADGNIYPEVEQKLKTLEQGAATTVWCATNPLLNDIGGVYCEDAEVAVPDLGNITHLISEPSTLTGVQLYALDKDNAQRLWSLSEELIGIKFEVN